MSDIEKMLVAVRRHPQDWQTAHYELGKIRGLRWDSESGGVRRATPYPMVMGYVWCDSMTDGELAHSCAHGPPPHEIKVCCIKKLSGAVWPEILRRAGPRPSAK